MTGIFVTERVKGHREDTAEDLQLRPAARIKTLPSTLRIGTISMVSGIKSLFSEFPGNQFTKQAFQMISHVTRLQQQHQPTHFIQL